ncbi:hypothetical protein MTO96_047916 [Rhipicephalus appendiculatus]
MIFSSQMLRASGRCARVTQKKAGCSLDAGGGVAVPSQGASACDLVVKGVAQARPPLKRKRRPERRRRRNERLRLKKGERLQRDLTLFVDLTPCR